MKEVARELKVILVEGIGTFLGAISDGKIEFALEVDSELSHFELGKWVCAYNKNDLLDVSFKSKEIMVSEIGKSQKIFLERCLIEMEYVKENLILDLENESFLKRYDR